MPDIVVPSFPEDRGPVRLNPTTGSSLQRMSDYCRDLNGCGTPTHKFLSQSVNINECTDCVREFIGSASISLIMENDYITQGSITNMIDFIKQNMIATGPSSCIPN